MKSVLIGSVGSSRKMLEAMIEVGFPITYVFSLDESAAANVSGYEPIHELAAEHDIDYKTFKKINDQDNVDLIKQIKLTKDEIESLGKKLVEGAMQKMSASGIDVLKAANVDINAIITGAGEALIARMKHDNV